MAKPAQGTFVSFVTGATGALGGAVARELAARPGKLVLAVRDTARAAALRAALSKGPAEVELVALDLSDMGSIRRAAGEFSARHDSLSLLVNAAAVFVRGRQTNVAGHELMYATNHLGPFLLTNLLLPQLRAGAPSRVLTVTAPASTHLDFSDLDGARKFSAFHAFGASKSANILFTRALARRVGNGGITPIAFHPGLLRSNLMKEAPAIVRWITGLASRPPEAAASTAVALGTNPAISLRPGGFYVRGKEARPPAYAMDEHVQEQLWSVSVQQTGLPPGPEK